MVHLSNFREKSSRTSLSWTRPLIICPLAYVESWLKEAQPKRIPGPSGPPGPPAPSPISIPIPSDLLPPLRPGLEAWDRLHLFARCRRKTAPIWEKCEPSFCESKLSRKSRRVFSPLQMSPNSAWVRLFWRSVPGSLDEKKRGKEAKQEQLTELRRLFASSDWFAVKQCCHWFLFWLVGCAIVCFFIGCRGGVGFVCVRPFMWCW